MQNKKLITTIILLSIVTIQLTLNLGVSQASAATPTQLKIYAAPGSVLADNNPYTIICIQFLDAKGAPARAVADTTIYLSSSATNIATVDASAVIKTGTMAANATIYTTYTPGVTTITAAASGYQAVAVQVTTVGPLPSTVAVYGFPPLLPTDGGTYAAVTVQLQDSSGTPAKAPIGGATVTLLSSNVTVGTVDPTVFIAAGSTYAIANFNSTQYDGNTTITPVSSGYNSKTTIINTHSADAAPSTLKVYVAPAKTAADGNTYPEVAVEVQNSKGDLAQASQNIVVSLASSVTTVGTVDPTITILAGQSYAVAYFHTTYRSGPTAITAAATNCMSDQGTLTTVGPIPTQIAVYGFPSALPADNQRYTSLQVQLQDSNGKPAKDPVGDVIVNLFSSVPDAGTADIRLTIPFGQTQVTGTFYTNYVANATTITATASGYASGQTKVTTYIIEPIYLNSTVSCAQNSVPVGTQTNVTALVMYNGTDPAANAAVTFTSSKGGAFSATTELGNGLYMAVFTAPRLLTTSPCTITANAAKTGYNTTSSTTQITIAAPDPSPTPTPTASPTPTAAPTPTSSPTATPTPTPSPTLTPTAQPTPTPTPTPASNATPTATPTVTPQTTATPKPTAAQTPPASPTATPQPTDTPAQSSESPEASSAIPTASASPSLSPTSQVTAGSIMPPAAVYALIGVVSAVVAVGVLFFLRKKL